MALSLEQHRNLTVQDYRNLYQVESNIKLILTKRIQRQRRRSLGALTKKANRIPDHLIIEILSRLPVKALLQFRSVCKLWYDIIRSSYFISKHLRNYYDNNSHWRDCLIVQYSVTPGGELGVFELLLDNKKNRVFSYQEIYTPVHNTYLCGPCDGIYYLWCWAHNTPTRSLWNPALNEFKGLPDITWKPNIPPESAFICESYGFGYDSKTNDYKVILILVYWDTRVENSRLTDNPMSILIYSLRSNSWKYWGDVDNSYDLERCKSYVFVNGCCYWLARLLTYGWDYGMIFSFDITADTYQEIQLPEVESKPGYGTQLIVYQDSIAFVSVPKDDTNFCIWTWNEGIWTQKFSMNLDSGVRGAFSVWRDNMFVFSQGRDRKLVLCDTNTKEIVALDDPQKGGCENICAYKESLVSIKNFGKDMKRKGRTRVTNLAGC